MNVVIAGAWSRSEAEDEKLVNALITKLAELYPSLWIITAGCDRSIGKIVKNRCMPKERGVPPPIYFSEIAIRNYTHDLPKMRLAQMWSARNALLYEVGEEFHLFMESTLVYAGSHMQNLLQRVQAGGRRVAIYYPQVDVEPKIIGHSKE